MSNLKISFTRTALVFAVVTAMLLQSATALAQQGTNQDVPVAPSLSHQTSSGPAKRNVIELVNRGSNLTGPLLEIAAPRSVRAGAATSISAIAAAQRTDKQSHVQPEFGGTYNRLDPQQRRLVDDWFARYNKRTQRNVTPEDGYNAVPISIRTTFEAVTNALRTTSLTSKQGGSLGNALNLVEAVETARGGVPRARGDLQFRIYVILKSGALATLNSSREFNRGADNTVFHHSYPLNYRQTGGVPSIQISMSLDGERADIDVDYRSSGFPAALFNGHLTAENSDVRAGNNYNGHLQRWQGLSNWWRNLFGVPVVHDSGFAPDPEQDISRFPRLTDKVPLAAAVNDYLSTWLVQGKPNLALAYVSARSYTCFTSALAAGAGDTASASNDAKQDAGKPVPRKLWNDMEEVNFLLGQPGTLENAVAPVELSDPALLPIAQKGAVNFTLAKVPDDIAANLTCSPEASSTPPSRKYGKYYASVFRLRLPGNTDAPILLLWQKELGYWQIVARQIDPSVVRDGPVPQAPALEAKETAAATEPPAVETQAAPEMLKRIQSFFDVFLLERNSDLAFSYFAPSAYPCVNLALEPGMKAVSGVPDEASYLRRDLKEVVQHEPKSQRLEQIIESYDPEDPTLKRVHHAHERAYMLAKISNAEAIGFQCGSASRSTGGAGGPKYVTFFHFIEPGGESAGLGLLWSKESGDWKIIAFRLDEP
jgi:hypothetical protein